MSYIRSGSNPEKLYIVGTGRNVEIMEGSKPIWYIPHNIFNGLLRKFIKTSYEFPCKYRGACVDEVWVNGQGWERTDEEYQPSLESRFGCKVKFTYGENYVYMWYVTWVYIVGHEEK